MMKLFFLFLLISNFSLSQDNDVVWGDDYNLEAGTTQYLFGDKVKLREKPTTDSEELNLLTIGTSVTILEMSEETMWYQGIDWNWYKVKAGNQTGYILGGLIALRHSETNGDRYLVSLRQNHDENDDRNRYVQYRILTNDNNFISGESHLYTWSFSIQAYDDRGVEGIENMLYINLEAESCGVDGGGFYVFNDGDELIKAISLSDVADGGVFYFTEELTFPNDKNGHEGYILYKREHAISVNEEFSWMRSKVDNMLLKWEDGEFVPNIEEIDFDNLELDEDF